MRNFPESFLAFAAPVFEGKLTDLNTRLAECFQRVFPALPADRVASATPAAIAEWDSLASISLVTLIEQEFNVLVDFEELAKLESFHAVEQYVRTLLPGD